MTAAQFFKATQKDTITPRGRIRLETVEQVRDNAIRFETEDGSKLVVTFTPDGDEFHYSQITRSE